MNEPTQPMIQKKLLLSLALILLAGALSACVGGAGIASSWPGLTVDGETAYLAYNNHVYGIQLPGGTEIWRYPRERENQVTFFAEPAPTPDEQLIAGGYDSVLYSLNPANGQENWQFAEAGNRYIASPLAVEEGIFAPSADNTLYALELDGTKRWEFSTQGEIWARPVANPECECIYLASMDHHVYAVDPQDGRLIWQTQDLGGAIVGTPTLSETGVLYVGTFGSEILALNVEDGSLLWEFPTEGWVWSGPALANDRLYGGDLDGFFYALDAASGAEIWRMTPDQLDGPIAAKPLVTEEAIYITTELGSVFAVSDTGSIIWTKTLEGKIYASPVLAGDMILVTPSQPNRFLVALDKQGTEMWSFPPPEDEE
jgi:outer membrane protein assembly factor BamB